MLLKIKLNNFRYDNLENYIVNIKFLKLKFNFVNIVYVINIVMQGRS